MTDSRRGACRTISCALFGLYIFIAAFIYLSFVGRFSLLTANCACASAFITTSALLVLLVGAFPFLSHSVLEQRNSAFDIDALHASNMKVRSLTPALCDPRGIALSGIRKIFQN